MCVPGCLETVSRQLSRRGLIGGAGLAAVAGAASTLALPARAAEVRSFTRAVDLTHALGPDFPTYDGGANLEMETLVTLAKDGYNMARWHLVEHTGTHMDAPIHFGEGVQSADAIRSSTWWCRSRSSTSGPRRRTTLTPSSRWTISRRSRPRTARSRTAPASPC